MLKIPQYPLYPSVPDCECGTCENLAESGPAGAALSSSENHSNKGSLCWSGTENCTLAAALRPNQRWATLEKAPDFSVCLSPPSNLVLFPTGVALSHLCCLCLSAHTFILGRCQPVFLFLLVAFHSPFQYSIGSIDFQKNSERVLETVLPPFCCLGQIP